MVSNNKEAIEILAEELRELINDNYDFCYRTGPSLDHEAIIESLIERGYIDINN